MNGLGKTFLSSEKADTYDCKILVVCQKSKVEDWCNHFNSNYSYDVFDLTKEKNLDAFINTQAKCVGIINYDVMWRRKQILSLLDYTLILDESSLINNKSAKRTKFILKMLPSNTILLSGTVCGGKYENLWTQCKLLGYDISEELFLKQYVNFKKVDTDVGIKKVIDKDNPYKNFERLKRKLGDYGAVFMKTEEVINLPQQNLIIEQIKATKEYYKFMKNSIVDIDGITLVGDTKLTKRLYARQLCAMYNQTKYDAVKDLLESSNDRVVIFYNFNAELDKLKSICEELERPISEVNGTTKDLKNFEELDNTVLLVQYQAGAMGLNLQKANKIIYFSLTESSDLFEQSKKRIHRLGTTQPCFYYILMCKGTVEESIYNALLLKQDYNDALFEKLEEQK